METYEKACREIRNNFRNRLYSKLKYQFVGTVSVFWDDENTCIADITINNIPTVRVILYNCFEEIVNGRDTDYYVRIVTNSFTTQILNRCFRRKKLDIRF